MAQKHQEDNKAPEEEIKDEAGGEKSEEETTVGGESVIEESKEEDWQAKADEYLGDLKRMQAEFENYKKRQVASQKELGGYLIEKLVLDIIPVLDNFRSATLHVPAEQKESPWVIGIQYIEKQLESVLVDNGMQTIEVKEGEEFDPNIHEAISQESSESESPDEKHKVATVIQKGYKFGERVIRPAKVTVK